VTADGQQPGAPGDNTTLVDVLRGYEEDGWTTTFGLLDDGSLRCGACEKSISADAVDVHSLRRLEGASDPADMLAVVAVKCPHCASGGVITLNYGPEMTEGQVALLHHAQDKRFAEGAPAAAAPDET
jgi:hypothetical protein